MADARRSIRLDLVSSEKSRSLLTALKIEEETALPRRRYEWQDALPDSGRWKASLVSLLSTIFLGRLSLALPALPLVLL